MTNNRFLVETFVTFGFVLRNIFDLHSPFALNYRPSI